MSTLSLDLATKCGFAVLRPDGKIESGVQRFAPKTREGDGARWVRFRGWLVDMKQWHPHIRRITWERVDAMGPGQVYAQQVHGGFVAILQAFCEHHGIEYQGIPVKTIKKRWTGNGNAKKPDMVARARELGFAPKDDNEADAIAQLHVALDTCPHIPVKLKAKRPKAPRETKAPRPPRAAAPN